MTHSHRRKNSSKLQFRMDVPEDIRDLAGKTSWTHTLNTSEPTLADSRRATFTSHYKAEVIRLRAIKAARAQADARLLVKRAFARLRDHFGSMDQAVASELEKLATIVRSSWSNEDARAVEEQHLGKAHTNVLDDEPTPISAIDSAEDRRQFRIRAEMLEGVSSRASGIVYQELARSLLGREIYQPIDFAISYLPYLVQEIDLTTPASYNAIANAYLTVLAEHEFKSWPEGVREALLPIAVPQSLQAAVSAVPPPPTFESRPTLREAFEEWKRGKRITGKHKTADEFETAINRFEALCSPGDITRITKKMVRDFIRLLEQLPARPSHKIRVLPPEEQIAIAEAQNLPTLSPATVGKHVAGIGAILAAAIDAEWIENNPVHGVTVEGARWEGDERDHFSDEDMHRIYTSPLMTDPNACDDTMFWILFLAPFHGSRPGEHCKLKPNEVVQDDGQWIMRFRRDRRRRATGQTDETQARTQKTRSSVREVPLHWIVIEGGFIEFVQKKRASKAEWIFDDLTPDIYGDRYKELSRRINRELRSLGISDLDKAFYSTRHTMKREGRRRRIPASSLDQFSGHASGRVGDKYGQGVPIETLKDDIDRLEFRSVPWDAVVACARARLARIS
ncbi:MAG TPA: DUF6538 domain-containing protein [Sphingomonas sp.]|nr:DUF6538 domain-containing protein [Sphingomonas sp.]